MVGSAIMLCITNRRKKHSGWGIIGDLSDKAGTPKVYTLSLRIHETLSWLCTKETVTKPLSTLALGREGKKYPLRM